jgi:hypothetical protein
MITVTMSTVTFLLCLPEKSTWKSITVTVNVTAASVMACRVFRELKLGFYADPTTVDGLSGISSKDVPGEELDEIELHSLEDQSAPQHQWEGDSGEHV